MSERITWSPCFKPDFTSTVFTDVLPIDTFVRTNVAPSSASLKRLDDALLLTVGGPPDVEDVVEPFELDRAVHAEVGPRALRQLALQRHVHRDGAVLHGRVDARHAAGDDPVARVDRRRLPDHDVLRLRLGDLQLRLQVPLVGHAREVGARTDLLADFHRDLLQHAGDAGAHVQLVHLALPQRDERAQPVHLGLLDRQSRLRQIRASR